MPTILESVFDYEPDILMMIAENWGTDLQIDHRKNIAEQVAHILSQADEAREMFNSLSDMERGAIRQIIAHQGRIHWDKFTRQFGEMREMGAARRGKDRPHRNPVSVTEALFYKGLIGRAFFESGHGIREFAFLPDEFQTILAEAAVPDADEPLSPVENTTITPVQRVQDRLLDHACTLLSLLRSGLAVEKDQFQNPPIKTDFMVRILAELDLLDNGQVIHPEKVKTFLEAPRHTIFSGMVRTWAESQTINELDYLDDLECEGGWKNKPKDNRGDMLSWIGGFSGGQWYSLDDFVLWVRKTAPDFLRSGGEYEAWIIKHIPSGEFLRGLSNWDRVEGAYVRLMVTGPLVWTGMLEIGKSPKRDAKVYFRKTDWAETIITRGEIQYTHTPNPFLMLDKYGIITVDRFFPLHIRYLVARFCEYQGEKRSRYQYQVTPNSLKRAEKQGLKVAQLSSLLQKYGQKDAKKPLPKNSLLALERWGETHSQAEIHSAVLLIVPSPEIMKKILSSPQKKYILEKLNPTVAVITRQSIPFIRALLLEMGLLTDIQPGE